MDTPSSLASRVLQEPPTHVKAVTCASGRSMTPAREIRASVEAAGGRLEMSVRDLRDAFGLSRLTAVGRRRITDELGRSKLRLEPPLRQQDLDDCLTVVDARAVQGAGLILATARSDQHTQLPGRLKNGGRIVVLGAVIGFAAILLTALFGLLGGGGDGRDPRRADASESVTAKPTQTTSEAREYLSRANAAMAADDPSGARVLLDKIDSDLAGREPDIARRVVRARARVRLTERYIAATGLADAGSLRAAHRRMLALGDFRDAQTQANRFGLRAARTLIARARSVYETRPRSALRLLNEASGLSPRLVAIDALRSLIIRRQESLAASRARTPAVSNCDPSYSGACIPSVPYDLDCPEVSAVDFASVGSDPHGFDGDRDGVACEKN
jgi:hypothetical protein